MNEQSSSVYNPTTTISSPTIQTQQPLPLTRKRINFMIIFFGSLMLLLGIIVLSVGIWGNETGDHPEDKLESTTNWLVTILGIVLLIIGVILVFLYIRMRPKLRLTKARIISEPLQLNENQISVNNTEEKANLMINEAKDG